MADETLLDQAHAAMEAAPEDEAARLRFYEVLSGSELYLLLVAEPEGENVTPELFEVGDAGFVLVFDREDRLAQFVGRSAPYAALSGRVVAGMLAGQGLGMGVNLEVAPSSILLPPEAMAWLVETVGEAPDEVEARAQEFAPPRGLPEGLLTALDARLATAAGLADMAYLVETTYDSGAKGHLLGVIDAEPGAEGALARAVSEVLRFSGLEAAALDVGFFRASDPVAARLARVGLRFDLPKPEAPAQVPGSAPGRDPDKPPRLK